VNIHKQWVEFYGSLYLTQKAASSLVGFKFKLVGMIPQAFGITRLQLFNLYLKAELGFTGPAPTINALVIGGGICIGKEADCKTLIKSAPVPTGPNMIPGGNFLQSNVSAVGYPYSADYPVYTNITEDSPITHHDRHTGDDLPVTSLADMSSGYPVWSEIENPTWEDHSVVDFLATEVSQQATLGKVGAIAAKAYIGFDSGTAFFYAAISKVNFKMLIGAIISTKVAGWIPKFMNVGIQGFDQVACAKGQKSACWAYASFATLPTTIDIKPQLDIPMGLAVSARLTFMKTSMGMKLEIWPGVFKLALDGPAIKMFGNKLIISKSQRVTTMGPQLRFEANLGGMKFQGKFSAFFKFGWLGQCDFRAEINMNLFTIKALNMKIFGGVIKGNLVTKLMLLPVVGALITYVHVDIDIGPIGSLLKRLAGALVKPIKVIAQAVTRVVNTIKRAFDKASRTLKRVQSRLNAALGKCRRASDSVNSKKRACDRIGLEAALIEREQLFNKPHNLTEEESNPLRRLSDDQLTSFGLDAKTTRTEMMQTNWGWRRRWNPFNAAERVAKGAERSAKSVERKAKQFAEKRGKDIERAKKAAERAAKATARRVERAGKAVERKAKWVAEKARKAAERAKKAAERGAKAAERGAKAAVERARKAAARVCRGALSALAATMRGLCEAPIRVAKLAVSGAQAAVNLAAKAFEKATGILKVVMSKVQEAVKFVSDFQLKSISFTGGFKSMKVSMGATFLMKGRPKHFKLTIDMGPIVKSFANMAKAWLKKVFEKIVNGIKNFVNNLKNQVTRIRFALEADIAQVLAQMPVDARVLLEADMAVVSAQMDAEFAASMTQISGVGRKVVNDAVLHHQKRVALAVQYATQLYQIHENKSLKEAKTAGLQLKKEKDTGMTVTKEMEIDVSAV